MYFILPVAALVALSNALYTAKGSACSVECGTKAQNFTGTGDLVCLDTAYEDNSKGVLLKGCITCLSTSTYVNDSVSYNGNSDQYWYLWHIKYVQQYCLVDTPQTTAASNCDAKCSPMKDALDTSWIYNKAGVQPQYGFCDWNSSQVMTYGEGCAACLQDQEGGVIIGNLADTTYNACQTKPFAKNGDLVEASRDLFDSSRINSATSRSSASASASATSRTSTTKTAASTTGGKLPAVATGGATSTASPASSEPAPQPTGLSSGAAAGVGIGAALAVLAVAGGIFFWMRQRKRRAPDQIRLTTPPAYSHELPYNMPPHEISGKEKPAFNVSELDARHVRLQELDGTTARR